MPENTLSQMREKFRQTQTALLQMLDASDLAALHQPRDEEKWTLAIMLAHLTEARVFMRKQAEILRQNPGITVGRTLDNEQRLDAIIHAQQTKISPEQLKLHLYGSYDAAVHLLNSLSDTDLQIPCNHVRFGPMTLGEFIQRSIIDHDQAHVEQARAMLRI
jgi:hypothetical protein